MQVRYFGHSAMLIELAGTTLLVDPFITGNRLAESIVAPAELKPDVILLTHAHGDHWGDTETIAKSSRALVISNDDIAQHIIRRYEYHNVRGMNTGGQATFEWGHLRMTYARHSSSFPDGTYGGNPNGFLLHAEGKTLYLLGDTSLFSEMAWTGRDHEIDVAFLPVGDNYTMGPADAIRAAEMLRPRLSIPVHFNTFPEIEIDVDAWASDMSAAGFPARVLEPGETLVI
jgi:L-ascorbate metabolism protein UlaG (beta-lactamase superfamily)